jgi:hypothetical protein
MAALNIPSLDQLLKIKEFDTNNNITYEKLFNVYSRKVDEKNYDELKRQLNNANFWSVNTKH